MAGDNYVGVLIRHNGVKLEQLKSCFFERCRLELLPGVHMNPINLILSKELYVHMAGNVLENSG